MKLEIEVYDLGERLYHMDKNEIKEFRPYKLEIVSEYNGYTGEHWGDTSCGHNGGYPIVILYTDTRNEPKRADYHQNLFRTREEVVKKLIEKQ